MFNSNKENFLGVDIGTSSIKVVELANQKGRPRLVTYGFTEKSPSQIDDGGLLSNPEEVAAILSDICKKAKVSTRKAVAALPNYSVFTSIITLPEMKKKELAAAVSWEAKKIIPLPLEEISLYHNIIEDLPDGSMQAGLPETNEQSANPFRRIFTKPKKNTRVLIVGASKVLVKNYANIFEKAGLNLLSLETESFALIRSLLYNDKSTVAIVDLGASTSSITIAARGIPLLARSLEAGGQLITKTISTALNVNLDRAEQFKQDLSLDAETSENSLPKTVENALGPIVHEIEFTINMYNDANPNGKVEKIILTGGTALLGHISGYLSTKLNLSTYVGDPFAHVMYPVDLKPVLDRIGGKFSVAVGLAMREIE